MRGTGPRRCFQNPLVVFVSAFISLSLVSATSSSFAASLLDDDEDDGESESDDDEGFSSSSAAVGPLEKVGFANNTSKRCCAASVQSPRAPWSQEQLPLDGAYGIGDRCFGQRQPAGMGWQVAVSHFLENRLGRRPWHCDIDLWVHRGHMLQGCLALMERNG